ncbi:molybdopterin-dependent oxidoreductase [Massilia agilis]|uniref:Molybdopterin-dependent oxidoreductase n=1 Tax=Massilia agilis TaxID=1811226 RepID=A0ABT2D9P7_9BURK|nr:molybdopterin-dependent oxidoreductase [Massilia agilis]MCS0807574.1 molybdopterin-dependent oxidoreductase [Massilia agilis]
MDSRRDPLQARLTNAPDRLRLDEWLPPQHGIAPRIRFGKHWINTLWAVPLLAVLLAAAIVAARYVRTLPSVAAFMATYPGLAPWPSAVHSGFPWWLRLQHFLNLLFMVFIIRSGIQILADHPRLYWSRGSIPGREWFRFQRDVPQDRVWTSKDDSVTIPAWLGIPGVRHSVGLARWWHLSFDLLWLANGLVSWVLLFSTDQWHRLVPTSWSVFPNALSTALQYLSLQFPVEQAWTRYNALQQLTYFITVFIAAPLAAITGLMQSPAIANRFGGLSRRLSRQAARSVHFLVMCWFVLFIFIHVTLVFTTGMRRNLNFMFAGVNDESWRGVALFAVAMAFVALAWVCASPLTIRHARLVQRAGRRLIGRIKGLAERWEPRVQYADTDISSYFWLNGTLPRSAAYEALRREDFAAYRLRIGGLVARPCTLSFAQIKAMDKQVQVCEHFCIQGWSGVAKWGGLPMRRLLELVGPLPGARYVVFYSFADGAAGGRYYDVHSIENMRHALSLLAYEMNDAPLTFMHGAPLRLRCENELGFKMVKWIEAIELVDDFSHLGAGQGGYNEDHEFYGYRMPI